MSGAPDAVIILNNCGRLGAAALALNTKMETTEESFDALYVADHVTGADLTEVLSLCEKSAELAKTIEAFGDQWLDTLNAIAKRALGGKLKKGKAVND